ncbi:D-alanyl-D-alanine carboxypeptidase family protein [Clostridium culturomicium]|uniref:D-alanyl-D-alanine carboxypeptidase family protein n=1 Tax=Clostridium culturomicium TaxID=1499683 RepID=UPI0038572C69
MKRLTFILLTLFTFTLFGNYSEVFAASEPPSVTGQSVIVMDANTGAVVLGRNEHTQYPPASTTKLMTILLTLENCKMDEVVTVGSIPPFVEGSKIYIHEGEKMTVEQMLYAVIMASANDCATALAEHISGSIEAFAELMNKRAKELGAMDTNFENPHGLYGETHRSTTYDLALMEKELLKYPKYVEISQTKSLLMNVTNKSEEQRPLWNDNRLVQDGDSKYYPYAVAGKTGYTDESKHSYVASAKKENQGFVVAILYDEQKAYYNEVEAVFEWAFENFTTQKLFSKGDQIGVYTTSNGTNIPLIIEDDIYYSKDLTSDTQPKVVIDTDSLSGKYFNAGEPITSVNITYNNQTYTAKVSSTINYEEKTLPVFGDTVTTEKNTIDYIKLIKIIVGSIIGILILFLILILIIRRINLKKRKRKNMYVSTYKSKGKKTYKNY